MFKYIASMWECEFDWKNASHIYGMVLLPCTSAVLKLWNGLLCKQYALHSGAIFCSFDCLHRVRTLLAVKFMDCMKFHTFYGLGDFLALIFLVFYCSDFQWLIAILFSFAFCIDDQKSVGFCSPCGHSKRTTGHIDIR